MPAKWEVVGRVYEVCETPKRNLLKKTVFGVVSSAFTFADVNYII